MYIQKEVEKLVYYWTNFLGKALLSRLFHSLLQQHRVQLLLEFICIFLTWPMSLPINMSTSSFKVCSNNINVLMQCWKYFFYSQDLCPFKCSFWSLLSDNTLKKITKDLLVTWSFIVSDHIVKLAGLIFKIWSDTVRSPTIISSTALYLLRFNQPLFVLTLAQNKIYNDENI